MHMYTYAVRKYTSIGTSKQARTESTHCYHNIITVTSVTYITPIDLLLCLVRIIIDNDVLIHVWIEC